MKKLFLAFKKTSIKTQFKIIAFSTLISCLILVYLVNNAIIKLLVTTNMNYVISTSSKFENEISTILKQLNDLCEYIRFDKDVQQTLIAPYPDKLEYFNLITQNFLYYQLLNPSIRDISLVSETIHLSSIYTTDKLTQMYNEISENPQIYNFGIRHANFPSVSTGPVLVMGCNIYDYVSEKYDNTKIGITMISYDLTKSKINISTSVDSLTYFMMIDKFNNIYPFNCSPEIASSIQIKCSKVISNFDTVDSTTQYKNIETDDFIIRIAYLPSKLYIVSAIDKDKLNDTTFSTKLLIQGFIVLVLALLVLLIIILSKNIVNPINQFYNVLKEIQSGKRSNLKSTIHLDGCSEIASLTSEFNSMLTNINELNHRVFQTTTNLYETELRKNEAEISFLRSQINPHFLYNTLELLRGIALEKNVPEIAAITASMGKMYRYSVKGDSIVSFKDELEVTKAYVSIQQLRFLKKFEVIYDCPDDTLSVPVIKMLLQPIVENSIVHALEKLVDGGILYIGSKIDFDTLIITIRDNGSGINPNKLLELQTEINSNAYLSNNHIGLININARIKIQYGSSYGLLIESEENCGTVIRLRLPIKNI